MEYFAKVMEYFQKIVRVCGEVNRAAPATQKNR